MLDIEIDCNSSLFILNQCVGDKGGGVGNNQGEGRKQLVCGYVCGYFLWLGLGNADSHGWIPRSQQE